MGNGRKCYGRHAKNPEMEDQIVRGYETSELNEFIEIHSIQQWNYKTALRRNADQVVPRGPAVQEEMASLVGKRGRIVIESTEPDMI